MESAGAWRHLTVMIGLFLLCCHSVLFERRGVAAGFNKPTTASGLGDESQVALNSVEHIWGTTTVAVGDTAVLHCSFDALFQQLPHGNIDWLKEQVMSSITSDAGGGGGGDDNDDVDEASMVPTVIATGRTMVTEDRRYRVYRPHNSALSVLIIRRAAKTDAGVFRCNLAGSSTRQKYLVLNVTDSKIEAQTSPTRTRVKVESEVTLWCNATGYPVPVVYWSREDRGRRLPDGSYQYWGNGLHIQSASETDTGVYVCHLDNFVQPVVTYKFTLFVEDSPWRLDAYKMRYDSKHWFPSSVPLPAPVVGKSFLLMCETRGTVKPPPTIDWYLDGKPISTGKHFYVIHDATEWRQRFVSSTLVIMRYSPQFNGKYTCLASNGFRIKRQTFRLRDAGVLLSSTTTWSPNQEEAANKAHLTALKPAMSNEISATAGNGESTHYVAVATDAMTYHERRESDQSSLSNSSPAREHPTAVAAAHAASRDKRMHSGRD